jgi:hypothetical protein
MMGYRRWREINLADRSRMRIYNTELFYPMLAMFLWTVAVMLRNMQVRVAAVKRGELTNKYFELLKGAEPPEAVQKTGNPFRNLTEIPPLFYIICLTVMFLGRTRCRLHCARMELCRAAGWAQPDSPDDQQGAAALFSVWASNIVLLIMWVRLAEVL